MLTVGLTGGIGCGKSTAVDAFRVLGIPIIDADTIARELVGAGKPALKRIISEFGEDMCLENGKLDRARLRKWVFADEKALQTLETIIHPGVRLAIEQQLDTLSQQPQANPYVIVDVPLLVEKGYDDLFDRIVVVDCLPEQQKERIRQRDGLDQSTLDAIIKTQASREERLSHATDVLDNTGEPAKLQSQIAALHESLLGFSASQS